MVAFATASSYAYTAKYSDQYRAWVYANSGQSISYSVTLPSGYGWTSIWYIMNTAVNGDYGYASSVGGYASCSGPSGYTYLNVPYYANTNLYLSAYSSSGGAVNVSAYYAN